MYMFGEACEDVFDYKLSKSAFSDMLTSQSFTSVFTYADPYVATMPAERLNYPCKMHAPNTEFVPTCESKGIAERKRKVA